MVIVGSILKEFFYLGILFIYGRDDKVALPVGLLLPLAPQQDNQGVQLQASVRN